MKNAFFLLFIIFIYSVQTNKINTTSILPYKTADYYQINGWEKRSFDIVPKPIIIVHKNVEKVTFKKE
ncbi:hypothetical protein [Chryseobacterium sp. NFX27]|uniref:hypothetical protein n=1 Tax=Chryseobacterium sp. NFX27 TaxID=2819618 RepID=UPI003CF5C943